MTLQIMSFRTLSRIWRVLTEGIESNIESLNLFPSPREDLGGSNMQPTKTPIEARKFPSPREDLGGANAGGFSSYFPTHKFPSPREDLGGSNLYENRNWRHAEFVSVPSRGLGGLTLVPFGFLTC